MRAHVAKTEPGPNAFRFRGRPGHVESYFLRANDPERPRAIWLKATVLAPSVGPPVAEGWLIWFDGEQRRCVTAKRTEPLSGARFDPEQVQVPGVRFVLGEAGAASGALPVEDGEARFDLSFTRSRSPVADPLSIFPWRLLTPFPWIEVSGAMRIGGESIALSNWAGMQGHNWGSEHAFEYAWGQALFPGEGSQPDAMVEGFSGRIRVAGRPSPRFSALVIRRGEREYRFDTLFDFWRQEVHLQADRWTVRLRSGAGEVRLRMDAAGQPTACLGYENPDGRLAKCFNTKLADTLLEVHPRGEPPFTCRSPHGGALEILRHEADR